MLRVARHTARARPLLARARYASTVKYVDTTEDFAKTLTDAGDKLVVVDFTATWCGPCKMISPIYDELSAEYNGKAVLIKVDVDEAADIAQDCGISAMPTFQFYKHSERVSEFAGADPNRLKATIADLV